jgi:hypothetical protein
MGPKWLRSTFSRFKKVGKNFSSSCGLLRISAIYNELMKGNAAMIRQSFKNK